MASSLLSQDSEKLAEISKMDMTKYKSLIEIGDLVIVYLDVKHLYHITITQDEVFQCKYGALKHNDCIGKKFGSCIPCTRGWVYVLFPTPELWTVTLPHRTQILYAADISLILTQLNLKPGSVVCEAGTGSGSLSHSLIRTIAPDGILYTFDFHAHRVEVVQKEFKDHGLGSLVKVQQKDVCAEGFGLDQCCDAVFLDLPNPWEAVPHTTKVFKKKGGRICTFSPCIEQVQRTRLALVEHGFSDEVTIECLQRVYDVKKITQTVISFDQESVTESTEAQSSTLKDMKKSHSTHPLPSRDCETISHWAATPPLNSPGHTGYLTYASFLPSQTDG